MAETTIVPFLNSNYSPSNSNFYEVPTFSFGSPKPLNPALAVKISLNSFFWSVNATLS